MLFRLIDIIIQYNILFIKFLISLLDIVPFIMKHLLLFWIQNLLNIYSQFETLKYLCISKKFIDLKILCHLI